MQNTMDVRQFPLRKEAGINQKLIRRTYVALMNRAIAQEMGYQAEMAMDGSGEFGGRIAESFEDGYRRVFDRAGQRNVEDVGGYGYCAQCGLFRQIDFDPAIPPHINSFIDCEHEESENLFSSDYVCYESPEFADPFDIDVAYENHRAEGEGLYGGAGV